MFVRLFLLATTLAMHRRAPGGSAVLTRRRQEFTEIHERNRGVIEAAAAAENGAGRDLTEAELAAINADRERAEGLATEIETLVEDEIRAARVAAGTAQIGGQTGPAENAGGDDQRGSEHDGRGNGGTGNAQTQEPDPGHYRSAAEGSHPAFFAYPLR